MDQLKMRTESLADKNFALLRELFPNVFTEKIVGYDDNGDPIVERGVDADLLKAEIGNNVIAGNEERYTFTWPGKKKAILLSNEATSATLRPEKEKSVDYPETENLYIEGDNLEVLKILQETYLGKVKMIYIDPPYNTGKDSFVYDDDYAVGNAVFNRISGKYDEDGNVLFDMRANNESNGRYHTDWLNMIYPRLRLAKNLLSEDGIILINMDENEITNLQKVCAEIFGEQNDLGTIVWDKRNPKGDARGISVQHEYIVLYARNRNAFLESCPMQRPKKNAALMMKKAKSVFAKIGTGYTLEDANEEYAQWVKSQPDFSGGEKAYCKIDENGNVYRGVSMAWPNKKKAPDDYFVPLLHPVTGKPCPLPERGWRNPSATMKELLEKGLILFGKDESTQPTRKYLLAENRYENIPSLLYYGGSDTALLEGMGIPFDTPKALEICKEHVLAFTGKEDIILDFFAGSSTLAQAVMEANEAENARRKFIMVQIPEACHEESALYRAGYQTICEAGEDRIRKAGAEIKKRKADVDCGFRVLRLASSNMKDVYYTPLQTRQQSLFALADNIKEGRTPEDLLFQAMLELGVLLSSKIEEKQIAGKKVFHVADGLLLACFDNAVTEETVKAIAKKKPQYAVFRDSGMANDSVAANFEQIFKTYSPKTVRKVL
ncbi:MAG: site-specific DNA-methyltransferase [Lachnospiraceae bacterium]|nr:site-specific DNA-methyltransferase [Lachnospiraceae bacterium]